MTRARPIRSTSVNANVPRWRILPAHVESLGPSTVRLDCRVGIMYEGIVKLASIARAGAPRWLTDPAVHQAHVTSCHTRKEPQHTVVSSPQEVTSHTKEILHESVHRQKRWAWAADLNRRICGSRCRVG